MAVTFTGEVSGYYDYKRSTEGIDPLTGQQLTAAERIAAGGMAAAGFIPVVGWIGRGAKGGKALYSTAKGIDAAGDAFDAYKTLESLEWVDKSGKGINGLNKADEKMLGRNLGIAKRPGGYLKGDVDEHGFLSPGINRAPGNKTLLLIIEYSLTILYKMNGREDGLKREALIMMKRKPQQYFFLQALVNRMQ